MGGQTITATVAELPATFPGRGEDRARIGRNTVAVLDGASRTDTDVSVSDYVDHLGEALVTTLDTKPQLPLKDALTESIRHTAASLDLAPGRSPSATVSILRHDSETIDVLVLGDSPVYVAHGTHTDRLTDDRLARLNLPSRTRLFERLAAGYGYDDQHRDLARQMTQEKAPYLNQPGGYWIAEANADAGTHALVHSYPAHAVAWCTMLTDGADNPATYLGIAIEDLARMNEDQLRATLQQLHDWEDTIDPDAKHLPRFKRHDDKTIVVVQLA